jgi:riboflavin kinase / FMN adenylyltransferase
MNELTFQGRVEKGEGIAARLGCPTANIAVEQGVIIPALGLYVGLSEVEGVTYPSVVCINDGRTGHNLKMEVHLLGTEKNLEGKHMIISLLEKMRGLIPFDSEEMMTKLIEQDLINATAWFDEHGYKIES